MDQIDQKANVKTSRKGRRRRANKRRRQIEKEFASTSSSGKKLKLGENTDVVVIPSLGYSIINFIDVFASLGNYVKCKKCGGDVKFGQSSIRGLGFKLVVECPSCEPRSINSCPHTDKHSYEINRRLVFSLRVLGIGGNGIRKFCGLMDLPVPSGKTTYDTLVKNIHSAASVVCKNSTKNAMEEEINLTAETENIENPRGLTVSGYGTWSKRGLSSLYGVASLMGYNSGKVVDLIVKSAHCNGCESMKTRANTAEYEEWRRGHECDFNREGSTDAMEVHAVREMFCRSEGLYGVKYLNYVGDGDCKFFKNILESSPYEEPVKKRESTGHAENRKNETLDALIWKIAPKSNFGDAKINEISAFVATTIFNDGHKSLLDMLRILNVSIGPRAHDMCVEEGVSRINVGDVQTEKQPPPRRPQLLQGHEDHHILHDPGNVDLIDDTALVAKTSTI